MRKDEETDLRYKTKTAGVFGASQKERFFENTKELVIMD
jgi:hypothetical protein